MFAPANCENDPGFKREIHRLTRRGMQVAPVLAVLGVLTFMASYTVSKRPVGWTFTDPDAIAIWDELLILAISPVVFLAARTRWGLNSGRFLVSVLIVTICVAMTVEDVARGDVAFNTSYLSLALIVAVGTLPYRPMQTLALGLSVTAAYVLCVSYFPTLTSEGIKRFDVSRTVYMIVLTGFLVGVSAVLYRSRFDQYRAYKKLKEVQAQLIRSEKMASLGQLTAGIAHEIKNPLNFINNFAELNVDLTKELSEAICSQFGQAPSASLRSIESTINYLQINSEKINEQGKRADAIVRSMMLHARVRSGERRPVDLNRIVDEYVNLAASGAALQVPGLSVQIERSFNDDVGEVEVAPQELGRVLINLLMNAFDAVIEKKSLDCSFEPRVAISTRRVDASAEIRIRDNGPGIPPSIVSKIFEPFYTTKPAGKGTGLGLSISYDIIVNGHGGSLELENEDGDGASFVIRLPVRDAVGRRAAFQS